MAPLLLEDQIAYNKRWSVILVALVFLILFGAIAVAGAALRAPPLVTFPLAALLVLAYVAVTLRVSVATVIAATGARHPNPAIREERLLLDRVQEMSVAAGLPAPKVYVQDSRDINAFAAGLKPEGAVVCATTGALQQLNQEELQGVIGHEMSHILNRDMLLSTVTIGVIGAIAMVGEIMLRMALGARPHGKGGGGVVIALVVAAVILLVGVLLSRLVYLAMKRRREYLADTSGAYLTRNPAGLASALAKIKADKPDDPKGSRTAASLYIANPWNRLELDTVFATHPPIDKRIALLREMAGMPPDGWERWALQRRKV